MVKVPRLSRLDRRILRSKRWGKVVLGGVLLTSLLLGLVLLQGLMLALDAGRGDLVAVAGGGLVVLLGLDLFAAVLVRRQHRILDEAREDLEALVLGEPPE